MYLCNIKESVKSHSGDTRWLYQHVYNMVSKSQVSHPHWDTPHGCLKTAVSENKVKEKRATTSLGSVKCHCSGRWARRMKEKGDCALTIQSIIH